MTAKKRILRKAVPGYTLIPGNGCYKARKIGIAGDRVKKDPAFAMTRRYAAEFGYAIRVGQCIRAALKDLRPAGKCAGALTSLLVKALNTDTEGSFGERNLLQADLSSLAGFGFTSQYPFTACFYGSIEVKRSPGSHVQVQLPAFVPAEQVKQPAQSAYIRIGFRLVAVDMAAGRWSASTAATDWLPCNTTPVNSRCFTLKENEGKEWIYLLCAYIGWSKVVNGRTVQLAPSALSILAAWNSRTTQNNP